MTHVRKLTVWLASLAVAVGSAAALFWSPRCRLDVGVLSFQAADVHDKQGQPLWLVTVGITNRSALGIVFDQKTSLAQLVADENSEVSSAFLDPRQLGLLMAGEQGSHGEILFFAPREATALRLRLRFDYDVDPWTWRATEWLLGVWPGLVKNSYLGPRFLKYYWGTRMKSPDRHWRLFVTPELPLPKPGQMPD